MACCNRRRMLADPEARAILLSHENKAGRIVLEPCDDGSHELGS